MINIRFTHPVTQQTISYNTDKDFVIIYGKNAVGKTTLSKSEGFDKNLVFNEDYINKNVYSTGTEGTTISSKNRENFSNLWLGQNVVEKARTRQILEKERKRIIDLNKNKTKNYMVEIEKYELDNLSIIDAFKLDKFELNVDSWETDLANFVYTDKNTTEIKDEKSLIAKHEIIKNNMTLNSFTEKIKSEKLTNDLVFEKNSETIFEINATLRQLQENEIHINKLERFKGKLNNAEEASDIIEMMYTYHKDHKETKCIFCDNPHIEQRMAEWKIIFEDKNKTLKSDLITFLQQKLNYIKTILKEKSYQRIEPQVIDYLKDISQIIENKLFDVKVNKYDKLEIDVYSHEPLTMINIINLKKEMYNYVLNKHIDELVYLHNAERSITVNTNDIKEEIDRLMIEESQEIESGINEVLNYLGLKREIKVDVNKRSGSYTYDLKIKGQQVNTLSNGQKHRLALALFLLSLNKLDLTNKIVLIDDPVVSLDTEGYLQVRDYLKNKLIKEKIVKSKNAKLVILTHDYQYMFVQLFDILEQEEMINITQVLRLTENSLSEVELELLFSDDILLFKKSLELIKNTEELKKLPNLNMKIFRLLVDIKQREIGFRSYSGVKIKEMNLDERDTNILNKFEDHFYSNFKDKIHESFDPNIVFENLLLLKESCIVLGFNKLIAPDVICNLKTIIDENINNVENPQSIFLVLDSINYFIEYSDKNEVKNYINHPRNSFTKNLMTLIMDDTI